MLENEVIYMIEKDPWRMNVLKTVESLRLPDWWVCAGFVRSKVWDELHGFDERTELADVDVIYFDDSQIDESIEKNVEEQLKISMPNVPWSVKNQARMHIVNQFPPYASSIDAISKFPETVTAVGVSLNEQQQVILTAPHGLEDLFLCEIKPTPIFSQEPQRTYYEDRIQRKNWSATWPKVHVKAT
ncbi:MAG: nucleotidyltransferase family protein [Paenisporosarcina sp.]|nr:nucleotidyltransferase family protein [Paenisporosarcina sp.]